MTYSTRYLGKVVDIIIDRPVGSKHPKYDNIYPINYGYVKGILAPDGEELDAYILGVFEPIKKFRGECIAVIHRLNDADDKLIITSEGKKYSNKQIKALTEFQEKYFKSKIIRK